VRLWYCNANLTNASSTRHHDPGLDAVLQAVHPRGCPSSAFPWQGNNNGEGRWSLKEAKVNISIPPSCERVTYVMAVSNHYSKTSAQARWISSTDGSGRSDQTTRLSVVTALLEGLFVWAVVFLTKPDIVQVGCRSVVWWCSRERNAF